MSDARLGFVPVARVRMPGPLPSPMLDLASAIVDRPPPAWAPDLSLFDLIVVSTSGGKDSQVALDIAVREAQRAGVLDRLVVLHADLGADEWLGTGELAKAQSDHYGVPFLTCSRIGQLKTDGRGALYTKGERFGDLHDYVTRRKAAHVRGAQASKPAWYSPAVRFCTSEFKRGPLRRATIKLVAEWRRAHPGRKRSRCRVLSVQGLRADESRARAKRSPLSRDHGFTRGRREVWTWLPCHDWSEREVWATIRDSRAPYHWAYDIGMPRLSCTLCIFAPRAALTLAGHYNRQRLVEKVELERHTGDTFKANLALSEVLRDVDAGVWATTEGWVM